MDVEKLSVDGFNLNVSDAKARDMISDKYDPDNGTYVVGDTCINDDILYICNTDIDTPEDFDSTKWDADTIGHYCSELKSNLTELPYYQDGEEYNISSSIYVIGLTSTTGKNIIGTIFLPKIIPSGYTLTYSGSINNIRVGSAIITSGITISGILIRGDNAVILSIDYTTSANSNTVGNIVPNSLTLTFHAPT